MERRIRQMPTIWLAASMLGAALFLIIMLQRFPIRLDLRVGPSRIQYRVLADTTAIASSNLGILCNSLKL